VLMGAAGVRAAEATEDGFLSASLRSCSCNCSRINCCRNCVLEVVVLVLKVGGLLGGAPKTNKSVPYIFGVYALGVEYI